MVLIVMSLTPVVKYKAINKLCRFGSALQTTLFPKNYDINKAEIWIKKEKKQNKNTSKKTDTVELALRYGNTIQNMVNLL